jgi:hypothetical protein
VIDNGTNDADPAAGQLLLNRVCLGTYTITESVAPLGFDKDADDTRVQTVSEADLNAVVGTQGTNDPGTSDESDFHNRLGTITINKVDKLTGTALTVGGATFTISPNPFACHGGGVRSLWSRTAPTTATPTPASFRSTARALIRPGTP